MDENIAVDKISTIANKFEDYVGSFSYPELETVKSFSIDDDLNDAITKLVSVYAASGCSLDNFTTIINNKLDYLVCNKMLQASQENFKSI